MAQEKLLINDCDEIDNKTALRKQGIYWLTGDVEHSNLIEIQEDLIVKHFDKKWNDDVQIIINSPGGSAGDCWAIIDLMDWVRMDVITIGLGEMASAAACILAAGTKGKRRISPNSTVMIHQPWGYTEGTFSNMIERQKSMKEELEKEVDFWLARTNLKTRKEVEKQLLDGLDHYFTAEQALRLGIVDYIIGKK